MKILKLLAPLNNCQKSGERRPNDWLIVHLSHNGNETQRSTRVEWGKIIIRCIFLWGVGGSREVEVEVVTHRRLLVV